MMKSKEKANKMVITETFLVIEYKGKFFSDVPVRGYGSSMSYKFSSKLENALRFSAKEYKVTDDVSEALSPATSGRGAEKGRFVKYQVTKSYKKVSK
jgi:hypothetical protein